MKAASVAEVRRPSAEQHHHFVDDANTATLYLYYPDLEHLQDGQPSQEALGAHIAEHQHRDDFVFPATVLAQGDEGPPAGACHQCRVTHHHPQAVPVYVTELEPINFTTSNSESRNNNDDDVVVAGAPLEVVDYGQAQYISQATPEPAG
ncbi:hypothetical protein STCU_12038 [Strigomonas culicis]|uniref:Uncharacterized protein n=1 Tax=Strigomonas culicis TaxID=28005 RepID=S9TEM7_9TRYP|nr:hypothetical protein STCU_12038 [Strigomonas culicis]|eukprot:EPY15419.1 hypothetical protein STCU_12038 [Strigomonas culicis]